MSDEAGRLVFSRDPSGTFIDGMVFGTSGGGENANLEVLCALPYELVRPHASASVLSAGRRWECEEAVPERQIP